MNSPSSLPPTISPPSPRPISLRWRAPACAAAIAILLGVTLSIADPDHLVIFLFVILFMALHLPSVVEHTGLVVAVILTILTLTVVAFQRNRARRQNVLSTSVVFWSTLACMVMFEMYHPSLIRGRARWLTGSAQYKVAVLVQPIPLEGGLRHVDWDGWGMFAQDTEIYLVYDPTNELAPAAKSGEPGQYPGLPEPVQTVRRMEDQWYTVIFNTGEGWQQ